MSSRSFSPNMTSLIMPLRPIYVCWPWPKQFVLWVFDPALFCPQADKKPKLKENERSLTTFLKLKYPPREFPRGSKCNTP